MEKFKCDNCGETSTGTKNKVYDENFNIQKGVFFCTPCSYPSDLDKDNLWNSYEKQKKLDEFFKRK